MSTDLRENFPTKAQRIPRCRRLAGVLLVVMSISAVGLSLWLIQPRATSSTKANPSVEAPPSFSQRVAEVRSGEHETLRVTDLEVDDSMLVQIADVESLQTLILDLGIVTDDGIQSIVALPNLRHLRLRLSPITDQGFARLAQCHSLRFLNLPHAECTDVGVGELARLPDLRMLRLGSPNLDNDVAEVIAKFSTLQTIHLIGVPINDQGLQLLAAMPKLQSLYLDDAAVSEAGWDWLFQEHSDLHIHINQGHHDRDPQQHDHGDEAGR